MIVSIIAFVWLVAFLFGVPLYLFAHVIAFSKRLIAGYYP